MSPPSPWLNRARRPPRPGRRPRSAPPPPRRRRARRWLCSIFIASITRSVLPRGTRSPAPDCTGTTLPGMGAVTAPRASRLGRGARSNSARALLAVDEELTSRRRRRPRPARCGRRRERLESPPSRTHVERNCNCRRRHLGEVAVRLRQQREHVFGIADGEAQADPRRETDASRSAAARATSVRLRPLAASHARPAAMRRQRRACRWRAAARPAAARPGARDEAGVDVARSERGVRASARKKATVGDDADDLVASSAAPSRAQGLIAVGAPGDELGDHRVVVERDHIARLDAGIDPHMPGSLRPAGEGAAASRSAAGSPAPGPRHRAAPRWRGPSIATSSWPQRQRLAPRDAQLPFDQVLAGDHLGHRMLDLQPRVHLHEVEGAVRVDDELHRAGADIADGLGRAHGRLAHGGAQLAVMPGAGASSITFWWRRWSEQSRSNRWTRCRGCRRTPGSRCGAAGRQVAFDQQPVVAEGACRLALRAGPARRQARLRARRPACPCRRRRPTALISTG